jgi:hypothetical protein
MTLQQTLDLTNVLLDKYGSAYLTDEETISLLNMGTSEWLNRLFPDSEGGIVNFEQDSNVTANLQPLIYTITPISMNGSGIVLDSILNAALTTAAGEVSTYFRIGSIGMINGSDTYPVKYIKQNNRWAFETNVFKKPTVTKPRYALIAQGLQFFPISVSTPLTINVIKTPRMLDIDDVEDDMELSDYVVYNIIGIALKLAGVSIRDEELIADVQATAVQNIQ